jgi:uncharacterized protein
MRVLIALTSGLLFGLALLLSGMTDPMKVKGFLDVSGAWDPSLACVMGGACFVAAGAFALARRRERSWSGDPMDIPRNTSIDGRLILGGILFGAGWGLAGLCPGPALVNLSAGNRTASLFVVAMLVGILLYDRILNPLLMSRRPGP